MEGLTITEIASMLGLTPNTVKQRLFQRGVKPITKEAVYDRSAVDLINDFGPKGRPAKKEKAKNKQ